MAEQVNSQGRIISLQICSGHRKPMQAVEHAEAIANVGLKDDRHALAGSPRQVLLIEKETLEMLDLKPGQVKENITTIGMSLMDLAYKTQLMIGDEVVLEVTKP